LYFVTHNFYFGIKPLFLVKYKIADIAKKHIIETNGLNFHNTIKQNKKIDIVKIIKINARNKKHIFSIKFIIKSVKG
jgi:hypothetical protein